MFFQIVLKSVCLKLFLKTLELASTMYESEFYPVVVFWNGVLNLRKLFLSLLLVLRAIPKTFTAWKVSKYKVFSCPYFPSFGLNAERCSVSLCTQSECEKIPTRKNSVFGHFSRSDSNSPDACHCYCKLEICITFKFWR